MKRDKRHVTENGRLPQPIKAQRTNSIRGERGGLRASPFFGRGTRERGGGTHKTYSRGPELLTEGTFRGHLAEPIGRVLREEGMAVLVVLTNDGGFE